MSPTVYTEKHGFRGGPTRSLRDCLGGRGLRDISGESGQRSRRDRGKEAALDEDGGYDSLT